MPELFLLGPGMSATFAGQEGEDAASGSAKFLWSRFVDEMRRVASDLLSVEDVEDAEAGDGFLARGAEGDVD